MAKRKVECPPPGLPGWLATFGDMMSLLLTFFVLLVSFANFESQKIKEAIISLKGALGVMRPSVNIVTMPDVPFPRTQMKPPNEGREDEEYTKKKLKVEAQLKRKGLDRTIGAHVSKEGIKLVALRPVLFDPGSAVLRQDSFETLSLIAEILDMYDNDVRVEGHTSDATPEAGSRYPTNWELSGARACAIVRYFAEKHGIDPKRLSYVGYGPTRPAVSNRTVIGKAHNDRVVIKLVSSQDPATVEDHLRASHKQIPDDTETDVPAVPDTEENPRAP